MATIHFCGATGKVFRGRSLEDSAWRQCGQPERPEPPENLDEERHSCLMGGESVCPLWLEAERATNHEPYRFRNTIVVSGSERAAENRRACGEIVRQELAAKTGT